MRDLVGQHIHQVLDRRPSTKAQSAFNGDDVTDAQSLKTGNVWREVGLADDGREAFLQNDRTLMTIETLEGHLQVEATKGRAVDALGQVGGADEDAAEVSHLHQELVGVAEFPARPGLATF